MFQEIRVKTVLYEVYREHGCNPFYKGGHSDPNSISTMELTARRKAFNGMPAAERIRLDKMIDKICEKTGYGTDAALSILMNLGIFLGECEKKAAKTVH